MQDIHRLVSLVSSSHPNHVLCTVASCNLLPKESIHDMNILDWLGMICTTIRFTMTMMLLLMMMMVMMMMIVQLTVHDILSMLVFAHPILVGDNGPSY